MEGDISEAAEAKACDLLKAETGSFADIHALARYIQRVSDAAKAVLSGLGEPKSYHEAHLAPFILPDPLLIEAREIAVRGAYAAIDSMHDCIRAGTVDSDAFIQAALVGLKRGIELAEAKHNQAKTQIAERRP